MVTKIILMGLNTRKSGLISLEKSVLEEIWMKCLECLKIINYWFV